MDIGKKEILFVSHDASRTGAPIVLLNLLKWVKDKDTFNISILLKKAGAMEADFKTVGITYKVPEKSWFQRAFKKIASKVTKLNDISLPPALLKKSFNVIYLNTVASLDLAPYLRSVFNCPIICHVHENEFTIKNYYPQFLVDNNLNKIDRFIAVSKSTRNNLINQYNVSPEKISLVYEFIPLKKLQKATMPKEAIKKELGLKNEFIIGGSGITIWRKGIDLFLQLAMLIGDANCIHPIKLIWVGHITPEFITQYNYEANRLGVADKIIFTGEKATPQNYFQLFDVFALTSREDPFPLVALEAAALNKPILCFDNSGGIPEVIENKKNGIIVPYADVKAMAIAIVELMENDIMRLKIAEEAGKLIENFDVKIAGEQIVKVIEQTITN